MKGILITVIVFSCVTGAAAQGRLELTIRGFKQAEGVVRVGLFDNREDFLKRTVAETVVKVTADSAVVVFDNLHAGGYAVSLFHDRNGNGSLDTNVLGIPVEGFAFGNNAMGFFGPPSFDQARIVIGNSCVRKIFRLRHF